MPFNSSRSPSSWCIAPSNVSSSSVYYQATFVVSIVIAVLAPMTVAANGFILAAIWRNPSLRTPSYVLLAGLAFTDLFTGLITEPVFAVREIGYKNGFVRKKYCDAGLVADGIALYFSSLTAFVVTMTAVERWLHMSRRSLLTVRRVIILCITFAIFLIFVIAGSWYTRYYHSKVIPLLSFVYFLLGGLNIFVTAFAYFKVFQIIRHHQNQVQTNESVISMEKYKRSIFTILYILAVFVLSYFPYLCVMLVFHASSNYGTTYLATRNVCITVVFSSSFFNPLLYFWRIKEVKNGVKSIIRKLICKQS